VALVRKLIDVPPLKNFRKIARKDRTGMADL
jgi:hypothetical protein